MERQAFQRLKQPCIQVLQTTATLSQTPNGKRHLVQALANLLDTLASIASTPGAIDPKLAEYAFVPISQVLRQSRQVPIRALELCLDCVSVLLHSGWGGRLEPALSGQLLILFTFLAKPSSAENGIAATSEELQALSLKCTGQLLTEASRSVAGKEALIATTNIPALGEAILVTLESLVQSNSNSVKLAAVQVIRSVGSVIVDDDALASFFPRIVSSLTKILTPGSTNKAGYRVIELSLKVLTLLFSRLLSDRNTEHLSDATSWSSETDSGMQVLRSTSWLQATALQIKVALANIYKMRNHDKSEVRRALLKLCLFVVQDCRRSLFESVSMSIETVLSLIGQDGAHDQIEDDLNVMLLADQGLVDLLRESLHDWVVSFPRVMQSKDDNRRRLILHQISVALRLLGQDPAVVDDRLAAGLREGVSAVLADSKGLEEISPASATSMGTGLVLGPRRQSSFQPLQLRLKGQQELMTEFKSLLSQLAKSESAPNVLRDLVQTLGNGTQDMQLASYWLSVNLMRDLILIAPFLDDFIDVGSASPREELLDDLYSYSVDLLTRPDPEMGIPWQFHALALETVALQAERYQTDFRAELGEVLYPILHQLGNPNPALREHAITCLNIVSDACGFSSARSLVIDNFDYVVNAVGLKLAIGDVSPQAPQVLLMTMRLCGPSLLPYLDDLVGAIFEALERYHGYPKLVELLFSVLRGMAEEGVKAPLLAIEERNSTTPSSVGYKDISMTSIIVTLKQMVSDKLERTYEATQETPVPFPRPSWRSDAIQDPGDADDQSPPESSEPRPPAPRTYQILFTISELTQHYLTTSSPSLRTSLLDLLRTTLPALAKHEHSFLPLINTLWPVLLHRLQDPEAYIVANALEVIGIMCEHAGSFMRSRIESAFGVLKKLHRRTQEQSSSSVANGKRRGNKLQGGLKIDSVTSEFSSLTVSSNTLTSTTLDRPRLYTSTPARMIWDALVGCLCMVSSHVALRDEHFEEVLDMLEPVLPRPDVKAALQKVNADSVWLRLYNNQRQDKERQLWTIPEVKRRWKLIAV